VFSASALTILTMLWVIPNPSLGQDGAKSIRAGTKLLDEGDRLAETGQFTEAVIRYKRGFEQLLPELRKIPFKREVKRDVTKRENLKTLLLKELEEDLTAEEFRANEMAMKAFGLLPRDFNLKEALAQVYSEEVAAFYDPKTKTMHLIEEPKSPPRKSPTLLERLFGRKAEFDKEEYKTVIAHELTHALADQHYNLDALQKAVKKDDDRSLALSALIEGEATLTMLGASIDDWNGKEVVKMPAASLDWTFSLLAPFLPFMGGGKTLRQSPPIITESMLFPYMKGLVFCAKLANDGGWEAIDEAYREPPLSTEQILHPEKYRAKPDRPMVIDLGDLQPGESWKELGRNVLGEMQLAVMLRKHGGKPAAAGWDGDRYAVFEGPKNWLGLVWLSTWDSEDDAREFRDGYVRYQTAVLGQVSRPPNPIPDTLWRNVGDRLYVVQRRGLDVAVVEGFPAETAARLLEAAFRAKKTEMKPGTPVSPQLPAADHPVHPSRGRERADPSDL
jgi:hypothetical protein